MTAWVVLAFLAQVPGAPQGRLTGSIEGTVIDDATGAPVRRASVSIYPLAQQNVTAVTDAGGHFGIQNLAPGRYVLQAAHPAYPPGRLQGPGTQEVVLAEGEQKQGIVFRLRPGAALSGRVLDEDGDPIDECFMQVYARRRQWRSQELTSLQGSPANARGEFRFEPLSAGTYYLRAQCGRSVPAPHGLRPADAPPPAGELYYVPTWYPGAEDISGATPLKVLAGSETGDLEFKLRPVRTYWVRGRVLAPEGVDFRSIQLRLAPRGGSAVDWSSSSVRPTGEFTLRGAPSGSYDVIASSMGTGRYLGIEPIEVRDAMVTDVAVTLSKAADAAGRVESPVPLPPGARVALMPLRTGPLYMPPVGGPVAGDGTFELKGIAPGEYALTVQPLPPDSFVKSVWLGNREMRPDQIQIPEGIPGRLRVAVSARAGKLEAVVASESGDVNTPWVFAVPEPDTPATDDVARIASQQGGHYSWRGLTPGHYRVYALPAANYTLLRDYGFLDALKSYGAEVTIDEGGQSSVQVTLVPAETLARIEKELL